MVFAHVPARHSCRYLCASLSLRTQAASSILSATCQAPKPLSYYLPPLALR